MSVDRFCLVDEKKLYHWMICTEIVEDFVRNGTGSWSDHTVYVMQGALSTCTCTKTRRTPQRTSRSGVVSRWNASRSC